MCRQTEDDGSGSASATGTTGRSCVPNIPGAEDMMSEMTRRLRERRAKAENNAQVSELSWCPIIVRKVFCLIIYLL